MNHHKGLHPHRIRAEGGGRGLVLLSWVAEVKEVEEVKGEAGEVGTLGVTFIEKSLYKWTCVVETCVIQGLAVFSIILL